MSPRAGAEWSRQRRDMGFESKSVFGTRDSPFGGAGGRSPWGARLWPPPPAPAASRRPPGRRAESPLPAAGGEARPATASHPGLRGLWPRQDRPVFAVTRTHAAGVDRTWKPRAVRITVRAATARPRPAHAPLQARWVPPEPRHSHPFWIFHPEELECGDLLITSGCVSVRWRRPVPVSHVYFHSA